MIHFAKIKFLFLKNNIFKSLHKFIRKSRIALNDSMRGRWWIYGFRKFKCRSGTHSKPCIEHLLLFEFNKKFKHLVLSIVLIFFSLSVVHGCKIKQMWVLFSTLYQVSMLNCDVCMRVWNSLMFRLQWDACMYDIYKNTKVYPIGCAKNCILHEFVRWITMNNLWMF